MNISFFCVLLSRSVVVLRDWGWSGEGGSAAAVHYIVEGTVFTENKKRNVHRIY